MSPWDLSSWALPSRKNREHQRMAPSLGLTPRHVWQTASKPMRRPCRCERWMCSKTSPSFVVPNVVGTMRWPSPRSRLIRNEPPQSGLLTRDDAVGQSLSRGKRLEARLDMVDRLSFTDEETALLTDAAFFERKARISEKIRAQLEVTRQT